MDEDSKELVAVVTEAGVRGFFETIAAPLVEAGGWGADIIKRRRLQTQVKTLVLAKRMLDDAGLPANAVSPKLLVPLLENASLEDDPEEAADPEAAEAMQQRWAALLANAAAGELGASVSLAFPTILAELEPIEARIIDELTSVEAPEEIDIWGLRMAVGLDAAEEPVRTASLAHIDNLERLRLVTVRRPDNYLENLSTYLLRDQSGDSASGLYPSRAFGTPQVPLPERRELVTLTELGRAFVRACKPPASPT